MRYKRHTLKNGIEIVAEKIPHFQSISIGLWFKAGSVYEAEHENGISHFIEHMLFKGTKTRTAKQIAETMDAVGGQLNAFTAKECTCFYCKVIDEHLELALDLLSDMVLNSTFDEVELEKEKGVILEELFMYEDSPEDVAHNLLYATFFDSHPLGQPVLGTKENIEGYTKKGIQEYFNRFYTPRNLVISIAGNFKEEELISLIQQYFGGWEQKETFSEKLAFVKSNNKISYKKKDIEQAHLCIGFPGISLGQEELYSLMIFNNLFGGGMSSRLFQKIREDHGLAYSVFSYPSSYAGGGLFTIYGGMKPIQISQVTDLIGQEIQNVKNGGIAQQEFKMAQEQLKGNYILGLESTSSRMTAIGKSQLLLDKIMTPKEVLAKIDSICLDDVYELIEQIFDPRYISIALVSRDDLRDNIKGLIF